MADFYHDYEKLEDFVRDGRRVGERIRRSPYAYLPSVGDPANTGDHRQEAVRL